MLRQMFTEHPRSIGMSWGEHGRGAARMGVAMILGGLACLVHALIPGLFVRTTSRLVDDLHAKTRHRNARFLNDYEI
ncbi:DUF6356 family protein [Sphingomicrobium lutaoense]|uniref:Capsule biosynthesis protein n=1 Tax=Sphingomicrobium lutaoense TaxID=515949 RepID=A0A839Z0W6_9SPHN|nr:DUF6356 family protein [Sphingomicrobium lutaoense]MBB3763313.1 hypothetical protein [Sphingomicrobium lutaoense]